VAGGSSEATSAKCSAAAQRVARNGGIKVPLQIHGTTASPQFVPDIGGAAASLLKSEFSCAGSGGAGGITNAAGCACRRRQKAAPRTPSTNSAALFGKKKP